MKCLFLPYLKIIITQGVFENCQERLAIQSFSVFSWMDCIFRTGVLNLTIVLNSRLISILLVILILSPMGGWFHQAETGPAIISPVDGDVLQGVVSITGQTAVVDFRSAEISYSYEDDPTGTWFLLAQIPNPQTEGFLSTWDTTLIADGNYRLRLQVSRTDGRLEESVVRSLRVRNYTPIETPTFALDTTEKAVPGTKTPTVVPTRSKRISTPLPDNPVEITEQEFIESLKQGAVISVLLFFIIGIYIVLRKRMRGG